MSNYTKATNFASKDSLLTNNPLKIVKGTELDNEFNAIATAVGTKFDTASLAAPGPIGATTPAAISGTIINGTTGTFSGDVQMASANGGQLAGLRNYLINSGALVTQRAAATFTGNQVAIGQVDRWAVSTAGFTTLSSTLNRSGSLGGSASTTGYVVAFGATTTTGSGTITFYQRIESVNSVGLNGKTVTISGKLYQDTGSTVSATIKLSKPTAGVDNYTTDALIGSTFSVSVPTTANTSFSGQITIGSADATNGLQLSITFPIGAVTGKYFQISDLQIEVGPVATPFEQRPYGMELALCQRYYYRISPAAASAVFSIGGFATTTTGAAVMTPFPVTMRAAPSTLEQTGTATDYSVVTTGGVTIVCSAVPNLSAVGVSSARAALTVASGLTGGQGAELRSATSNAYLGWSAEL